MHQGCFYSFHSLELEVNQMQQHIVFFCIYACFIFRCKFDLCSFCSGTSWKWKTSSYDPHSFFTGKNCPSQHVCETLCKHQLLKDWNCLINQLSLITKRFQGTEKKKTLLLSLPRSWKKLCRLYWTYKIDESMPFSSKTYTKFYQLSNQLKYLNHLKKKFIKNLPHVPHVYKLVNLSLIVLDMLLDI